MLITYNIVAIRPRWQVDPATHTAFCFAFVIRHLRPCPSQHTTCKPSAHTVLPAISFIQSKQPSLLNPTDPEQRTNPSSRQWHVAIISYLSHIIGFWPVVAWFWRDRIQQGREFGSDRAVRTYWDEAVAKRIGSRSDLQPWRHGLFALSWVLMHRLNYVSSLRTQTPSVQDAERSDLTFLILSQQVADDVWPSGTQSCIPEESIL